MVTPEGAVEAIEAAARAICVAHGEWTAREWDEGIARERMKSKYRKQARAALEAAAPYIEGAALRAVADKFQARLPDGTGNGRAYNSYQVASILRSCADDLEPTT